MSPASYPVLPLCDCCHSGIHISHSALVFLVCIFWISLKEECHYREPTLVNNKSDQFKTYCGSHASYFFCICVFSLNACWQDQRRLRSICVTFLTVASCPSVRPCRVTGTELQSGWSKHFLCFTCYFLCCSFCHSFQKLKWCEWCMQKKKTARSFMGSIFSTTLMCCNTLEDGLKVGWPNYVHKKKKTVSLRYSDKTDSWLNDALYFQYT